MTSVNPYLNFNGNTKEAFIFYKSVFGGEFSALQRFKDTPEADALFKKLSKEGKADMEMDDMFWGAYFGMTADKFGIQWMINFTKI